MSTLRTPFTGKSIQELYHNILKGNFKPIPNKYSKDLSYLIGKMLKVSSLERITLYHILNLPFIKAKLSEYKLE